MITMLNQLFQYCKGGGFLVIKRCAVSAPSQGYGKSDKSDEDPNIFKLMRLVSEAARRAIGPWFAVSDVKDFPGQM